MISESILKLKYEYRSNLNSDLMLPIECHTTQLAEEETVSSINLSHSGVPHYLLKKGPLLLAFEIGE